jgi:hypothetical protein
LSALESLRQILTNLKDSGIQRISKRAVPAHLGAQHSKNPKDRRFTIADPWLDNPVVNRKSKVVN